MTDSDAKVYIDDMLHILKIMHKTSADKGKLATYIEALELAKTRLSNPE